MGMWAYIRDTLRWPLVHRRGPLACILEGVAGEMDEALTAIKWLREQFCPELCEDDYIDLHGASRGLTRYRLESDEQWRQRVVRAYAWQQLGGRHAGMPVILEYFGFPDAVFVNVRDEDEDRWAEFRVQLAADLLQSVDDSEFLAWLINEYKPARSKLASIQALQEDQADINAVGVATLGVSITGLMDTSVTVTDVDLSAVGVAAMPLLVHGLLPSPDVQVQDVNLTAVGVACMPIILSGYLPEEVTQ
ncbi:MAG: hypothetical protein PWQ57_920 [Desulfovibrionales bacterium]|nr:hypothetical protein [Desulfovibrionales bacterium]